MRKVVFGVLMALAGSACAGNGYFAHDDRTQASAGFGMVVIPEHNEQVLTPENYDISAFSFKNVFWVQAEREHRVTTLEAEYETEPAVEAPFEVESVPPASEIEMPVPVKKPRPKHRKPAHVLTCK